MVVACTPRVCARPSVSEPGERVHAALPRGEGDRVPLQSYGILMTRREVREGLERLLQTESTDAPDDVLLRDVPKRNLHVA